MKAMTVARFITQQIAVCESSQRAIAAECGYTNANIITMFKKGRTKLPLNKVAVMARALRVDPRHLLRLAMTEYEPEAWSVITKTMGTDVSATDDERAILDLVRASGSGRTPSVIGNENRAELAAAIQRAVERDEARDSASVTRLESLPTNSRRALASSR